MINTECPNATLHNSAVDRMMTARLELCEKKDYITYFSGSISDHFRNCNISFCTNEFIIKTNKDMANTEIECMMWASIVGCLKNMYNDGIIDINLYNKCINSPSLLYFITMNSSNVIKVKII